MAILVCCIFEPNYLISCLTSNKSDFFAIRDGSCSVDKLLSLCRLRLITSVNPGLADLPGLLCQKSHWPERAKLFWNWGHLMLSQAEIESSTKSGFTESTILKDFSPLLLLCWSGIILYANHNLNNIEQMSMLKAKCDFDGGDCCPNNLERFWDTYCNECQCLEWTWFVENSKGQFCLTLPVLIYMIKNWNTFKFSKII